MQDLSAFCCQNPECSDYGKRGLGNLSVTDHYGLQDARRMLRCATCEARFSERKGTPLFDCAFAGREGDCDFGALERGLWRPQDEPSGGGEQRHGNAIRDACGRARPRTAR